MSAARRRARMLVIGVFGLLGLAASDPGQTIVVTARSVKALADDFEYVVKTKALETRPWGRTVLGLVEQVRSGALVKGIDLDRVVGAAVSLPRDFPQGAPPSMVVAVPVSNLGQFLDSLKNQGAAVDDQPGVAGFSHKVTGPDGSPTLFVVEAGGYALLTPVPAGAEKLGTLDPTSWRRQVRPESNLSATIRISEIPQALKDQMRNQVQAQAERAKEPEPGEDDASVKSRLAGQKLVIDAFESLIQDGDALSLEYRLDRKTSTFVLEAALGALPGTTMAASLRGLGAKRSRFAGMGPDATLAAWVRLPIARGFQGAVTQAVESAMESEQKKANTPAEKQLIERFTELLKSNLNAPEIDLGLAIRAGVRSAPKGFPIAMDPGMSLTDGRATERFVRDMVAEESPPKDIKLAFDVAKAADGTAIHQMTRIPADKDADADGRFADASLSFAFRQTELLASLGGDSVSSLRRFIEGRSTPPARVPGAETSIGATANVAGLGDLAADEEDRKSFRRAAAHTLAGEDAKRDKMALSLIGEGDGVRLRLALDVPALRLLILLGEDSEAGN